MSSFRFTNVARAVVQARAVNIAAELATMQASALTEIGELTALIQAHRPELAEDVLDAALVARRSLARLEELARLTASGTSEERRSNGADLISVTLSVPATDPHTLGWWKRQAVIQLSNLLESLHRRPHGRTEVVLRSGTPSLVRAVCRTRPL